jgi:predicted CXXCH cytochrome family protein
MTGTMLRCCFRLALLVLGGLLLVCQDAAAQETCASAQCHATLLKAKTVHPPTETCGSCHESVATPHPQKGKRTFVLTQAPPALCFGCHEAFGKKGQVHPPVKDGACTTCHDPHASAEPKLLVQPLKDLCGSCHDVPGKAKQVHGPVSAGDCTACHAPHESDAKPLLVKPGEDLCFGCHQEIQDLLKKKNVHPALASGCTSCHNPHGADYPKLLSDEGAKVCYQCHDPIAAKVEKAPVVHAPVKSAAGCASCHSPHAADQAKLLLKPEKETCLGCHDKVITQAMTVLHGPINQGKCVPCHDPHGSQVPRLLVKEFPRDPYAPYTEGEYALCFGCHKRDLLQYPDTSFATNFRDGERNLHYLHVNDKQKGRSCVLCHDMHGSSSPRLIAESVPFGKWNLPLKFVKTETGGGCSPGCHRPAYYDRKVPGRKPEAQKPAAKGS